MEIAASANDAKCCFKGIFNFGDSNSDTGGFWTVRLTSRDEQITPKSSCILSLSL